MLVERFVVTVINEDYYYWLINWLGLYSHCTWTTSWPPPTSWRLCSASTRRETELTWPTWLPRSLWPSLYRGLTYRLLRRMPSTNKTATVLPSVSTEREQHAFFSRTEPTRYVGEGMMANCLHLEPGKSPPTNRGIY